MPPPPAGRAMPLPPAGHVRRRPLGAPCRRRPLDVPPPLPRWAWAGSVALKRVTNPMRGMSCRRLNMNVLER